MKRSNLLMLAGGLLAAVAFFLPHVLSDSHSRIFGPGASMFDYVQAYFRNYSQIASLQVQLTAEVATGLLVPVGALLLMASWLLAFRLRRAVYVWGLVGAALGLTFLLWTFIPVYAFLPIYRNDLSFWSFSPGFGIGYWLAAIGCVRGLVGALLGLLERPAAPPAPAAVLTPAPF